ncbi:MAG: hypothetical protein ACYC0X_09850 [Pirellulaceae bacterium]
MISDRDTLATLAIVGNELEAQLLVNLLEEHGIVSTATGGFTSQFRAEAPGVVRVMVKQDSLAAAQAVLAERDQLRSASEPIDQEMESFEYEAKLTRFGIWSLLIWELLTILAILAYWSLGGDLVSGLLGFVISAIFVAVILTRRWSRTY